MGWGTTFTTNVYIKGKTFENTQQIKNYLEEINQEVQQLREELCILVSYKFEGIPSEEVTTSIQYLVNNYWSSLQEAIRLQLKLELLIESKN